MQPELDYYAILQLPPGSSIELARENYRRLAKVFHPDRNDGDAWCQEQIKKINIAFEFLSDPARKAAYDATLAAQVSPKAPASAISKPGQSPARRPVRNGHRVFVARTQRYDFSEPTPKRPAWTVAASWIVVGVSALLFVGAVLREGQDGGGMRQMLLLPSMHTGLMSAFTGGGPKVMERAYRSQLAALTDSAESGIDDAGDTLSDLQEEDTEASNEPANAQLAADAIQRGRLEARLRAQSESLQARLTIATHDVDRFDWTTPGVRRRLHAGTIDSDLEQIDNAIDPLHDTVCTAQEMIVDHDATPATPQPTPSAVPGN